MFCIHLSLIGKRVKILPFIQDLGKEINMLKIQQKFSTFVIWFVKESLSFIYVSIQEREKSVPMFAYKFQIVDT